MKKTFILTFGLFFMCILFAGCDKEITETASDNLISKTATYKPMQDELQSIYDNMPEHDWGNIQVIGDGILKFECEDHFNRIYEWLRQDCETWDSLFLDNYNSLTDVFTHPRFSLDFLELGIGINSVIYYSIDQNNIFFQIFND